MLNEYNIDVRSVRTPETPRGYHDIQVCRRDTTEWVTVGRCPSDAAYMWCDSIWAFRPCLEQLCDMDDAEVVRRIKLLMTGVDHEVE